MNLTRDRLRSIGWVSLLSLCMALTAGLTLRVNAVKSEVHQAERRIVGMRGEISFLETEYQTRSNQHQLKILNDIEFGYTAPLARQYIEGERKLAVLGKPRGPGAPAPIRVAAATTAEEMAALVPMVSPVLGAAPEGRAARLAFARPSPAGMQAANAVSAQDPIGAAINAESLGERLSRAGSGAVRQE